VSRPRSRALRSVGRRCCARQ